MRSSILLALALSCLLLVHAPALASVDVEVPLNAKVTGTVATTGVDQKFRFDATAGTVLKVSVKGKGMDLAIGLLDPDDNPVTVTNAPGYRGTGPKVSLSKFTLESTGRWTLTVKSAIAGDYSLKLKGKAAKKAAGTIAGPAGGSTTFAFAAPAGSRVTLKAKAAKGSTAEPRIGDFDGADRTDEGKASSKSHTVKVPSVSGGDHTVEVKNLGVADGDVVVSIKIKAPKIPSEKLDVRGQDTGETSVEVMIAADQGGEVKVEDGASPLDGASVVIEAGALSGDTEITISSTEPMPAPEERQMVGPTLALGPPGTTFTKPVRVVVPYDPALMSAEDTPADLLVLHVSENGDEETLAPVAVDETNHLLTVETTSFSRFGAFGRRSPADLSGRRYWSMWLDIGFTPDPDYNPGASTAPYDSRDRWIRAGLGTLSFAEYVRAKKTEPIIPTGGSGSAQYTEVELGWGHRWTEPDPNANPPSRLEGWMEAVEDSGTVSLSWERQGRRIVLEEDGLEFTPNPDASILIGGNADNFDNEEAGGLADPITNIEIMIERSAAPPTMREIAGTYDMLETWFTVRELLGGTDLFHEAEHVTGTLRFDVDSKSKGTLFGDLTGKHIDVIPGGNSDPNAGLHRSSFSDNFANEKWSIVEGGQFAGAVTIDGTILFPSADRNVLMGLEYVEKQLKGGQVTHSVHVVLAVRRPKVGTLTNYTARGEWAAHGLNLELVPYEAKPGDPAEDLADIRVTGTDGNLSVFGLGAFSYGFSRKEREMDRDQDDEGGIRIETEPKTELGTGPFTGSELRDPSWIGNANQHSSFGFMFESRRTLNHSVGFILLVRK